MINDKKLLVMRGLPGAGKSTVLSKRAPSAAVCSADHFFVRADGKYVFEATKLKGAHDSCWGKFSEHMKSNTPVVAVDNTNLTWWEAGRYIEAGLKAGYKVEVIDLRVSVETAAARNVHNVPAEHIAKMARKNIDIPPSVSTNPNFKYTVIDQ